MPDFSENSITTAIPTSSEAAIQLTNQQLKVFNELLLKITDEKTQVPCAVSVREIRHTPPQKGPDAAPIRERQSIAETPKNELTDIAKELHGLLDKVGIKPLDNIQIFEPNSWNKMRTSPVLCLRRRIRDHEFGSCKERDDFANCITELKERLDNAIDKQQQTQKPAPSSKDNPKRSPKSLKFIYYLTREVISAGTPSTAVYIAK